MQLSRGSLRCPGGVGHHDDGLGKLFVELSQKIEYLPVKAGSGAKKVMVPTRISSGGAPPVPVNYRLSRNGDGWLVYDVVIDGISLVTNYRSTFARQIRLGAAGEKDRSKRMSAGIEKLIEALSAKNDKPA